MTAVRNARAMLISVVVPVLNEAATVGALLDHLAGLEGRLEVILADGGSTDATVQVACEHASAPRMIQSARGRARQMNTGAAVARGEAIIFLHADTRLPAQAYRLISSALADPRVIGGNFSLRFDGGDRFFELLGHWYRSQRRAGIYNAWCHSAGAAGTARGWFLHEDRTARLGPHDRFPWRSAQSTTDRRPGPEQFRTLRARRPRR